MDLIVTAGRPILEIRSPRCIHSALLRVMADERTSTNRRTAALRCEQLLLTGMVLFGWRNAVIQQCARYLADLWKQLGKLTEALTLCYAISMDSMVSLKAVDAEDRLRMCELLNALNAVNSRNRLLRWLCVGLVEDLLRDVFAKLGTEHEVTLCVQRHLIEVQSSQMSLKWTLHKYQQLLEMAQMQIGMDSEFTKDTMRIRAHNLQGVMLKSDWNDNLQVTPLHSKCESVQTKVVDTLNTSSEPEDIHTVSMDKDLFLRKSLNAASLLAQGKLNLAVQLYQELLFYTSSTYGETDQTTLCTKQTLAAVLHQQGRFDEALRNYRETLSTAHSALGNDHRVTKIARQQMGALTKKLERLNTICSYYTHERLKADWFNRIFVIIMVGLLLWLLAEMCMEHVR